MPPYYTWPKLCLASPFSFIFLDSSISQCVWFVNHVRLQKWSTRHRCCDSSLLPCLSWQARWSPVFLFIEAQWDYLSALWRHESGERGGEIFHRYSRHGPLVGLRALQGHSRLRQLPTALRVGGRTDSPQPCLRVSSEGHGDQRPQSSPFALEGSSYWGIFATFWGGYIRNSFVARDTWSPMTRAALVLTGVRKNSQCNIE